MSRLIKTLISIMLCICVLFPSIPFSGFASDAEVEVWRRTDIVLISSKTYTNPYLDVQVDAVFTHTDGTRIALAGFWNGENEWRVRFSPTKTGTWNYTTTCSDTTNSGLHNIKGSILAIPNTGTTDMDKHGFIRKSTNNRYFTYNDGTPFYWLGDTQWQAPNYVSISQCNYPDCDCGNQFKHEVDNRIEKGFNVFQTYFDSGENDGGGQLATTTEPRLWIDQYTKIDPATFTNKIDKMFDYLAQNGMVIALGYGVHTHTTSGMGEKALMDITRYLTARYASYPIVWITGQEITIGDSSFQTWMKSAKLVDELDGYNHPQGTHIIPANLAQSTETTTLDTQPWHEWWALQGGHGTPQSKDFYKGYWDLPSVKPFLETEACYEDVVCGPFNGYKNSRISAWKSNLCGSYGFTYGVTGIWANCYSTEGNSGWLGDYSYEPWYMGLDKPGSYEMTYLKNFFEYADFSSLVPRFNSESYSDFTSEDKLVSSSEDASTYVGYFYNNDFSTGTLNGLDSQKAYTAQWYNPLTGKFIDIDNVSVVGGSYIIPEKPTTGDWALLVTSRDLSFYRTEKPYTDSLIKNLENLAIGASAKASSYNQGVLPGESTEKYSADKAVDGKMDTYWCAKDNGMPQWIEFDLGKEKTMNQIILDMHFKITTCSYTISGSNDPSTGWKTLYKVDNAVPSVATSSFVRYKANIEESSYRYLKVNVTKVPSSDIWAGVYEFKAYYDESLPPVDPTDPEEPDVAVNLVATSAVTKVSSFNGGVVSGQPADYYSGVSAIDGDKGTYWCANNGNPNEWLTVDLGSSQAINEIVMTMHDKGAKYTYTVSGSNDESTWKDLHVGTAETPDNDNIFDLHIKEGNYQFLKVSFSAISDGHWAAIHEFEVYHNDVETIANLALNAPATSSSNNTAQPHEASDKYFPDKSVDGDAGTYWCAAGGSSGQWLTVDLGSSKTIDQIVMTMHDAGAQYTYTVSGSNDESIWTDLHVGAAETPDAYTFDINIQEGDYRYLRVNFTGISGGHWAAIHEFEVYHNGEETIPNLALSADALASTTNGDYTPSKAVDGNTATYWCAGDGSFDQWLTVDLDSSKKIDQIVMKMHDANTQYTYTVSGSNDKSSWTVLHEGAAETPGNNNIFDLNIQESNYRYLKVSFSGISNGNWAAIHEFEVFDRPNTEEPIDIPTFDGEKQRPTVTSIGSGVYTAVGVYSNTDTYLFDSAQSTVWKPFAPIATQTILMDVGVRKKMTGMVITLGKGSELPQYRIEGSINGNDWTILVNGTLREPHTIVNGGQTTVYEALAGNYRYVKLLWLNGNNNYTNKSIENIDLFADAEVITTYSAVVKNGTGSCDYEEDETVYIKAATPAHGMAFASWTCDSSIVFVNKNSGITSFIMPAKAVTVTANYKSIANMNTISGPTSMTLPQGYNATSTEMFTVTGVPEPTVTLSGNAAFTWNSASRKINIEAGLLAGTYQVTLTANNGVSTDASMVFTLTVKEAMIVATTDQGGSASNERSDRASSNTTTLTENKPIDERTSVSASIKAIATAAKLGDKNVTITLSGNSITTALAKQLAEQSKKAGVTLNIKVNKIVGNSIVAQLMFNPELVKKEIKLGCTIDSANTKATKVLFEKNFNNKVAVISLEQQRDYNMTIHVAVKKELSGMDTKKLLLYSYDKATNKYRQIPSPKIWVDANGYLRFDTPYGGDIIITDKQLSKTR